MAGHKIKSVPILLVGALLLFACGVWSIALAEEPQGRGVLTVAMLNIGQGDAIYIESPTGVQVLVDAGPGSAVLRELPTVIPQFDRTLDAVVATHPDQDHIGGLVDLLPRYEVAAYVEPGISKDTSAAKKVSELVDAEGAVRVIARAGMTMELGDGAVLEVLYPDKDVSHLPSDKANEGGIVLRLTYRGSSALFMADVSSNIENYLAGVGELDSDLLKVGHHGSRFSTSDSFIQEVTPEVAVISVGENSYGHPTPQALEVLNKYGAHILRTDKNGTVRCVSDGAAFVCN